MTNLLCYTYMDVMNVYGLNGVSKNETLKYYDDAKVTKKNENEFSTVV